MTPPAFARHATAATGDPIGAVLNDPRKRAYAAQFIGQAFVTAYNLIQVNRDKIENVANTVIEKKEIYGDDLVRLLDAQNFERPDIDWTAEETWPNLMNFSEISRHAERRDDSRPQPEFQ